MLFIALGVVAPVSVKALPSCNEKIKVFLTTPNEQTLSAISVFTPTES
jgi:hypothetical protein